jgi:hypothetical protein
MTRDNASRTASPPAARRCLNCEALLNGPYCAACGHRAIPPNPGVRELIGDAWGELTGYDGRIARTVVTLLRLPAVSPAISSTDTASATFPPSGCI